MFRFTTSQILLASAVAAGIMSSVMVDGLAEISIPVTLLGLFLIRTCLGIRRMT